MIEDKEWTPGKRCAWILTPLLLAVALAAHAQGQGTGPQGPDNQEPRLKEVIVTGSRIARPPEDRANPTIIVSSKTFAKRGYRDVGQALTELPEFGVQPSSQQNEQNMFGVGHSFVDLYSLGSQRTLTLVNGRRFVASSTSGLQVDLNEIPIQLISNVQTISIGGAPIYGADAIAGTVNIITKKHYQGLSLDAQWGSEGYGARNYRLSVMAGKNFADNRGNVLAVVEYTYSGGLTGSQVPYFAINGDSAFLAPRVPGKYANVLTPNETAPFISTSGVPMLDTGTFYGNGLPWTNCQVGICNAAGQPLAFSPGSSALTPYNLGTPTGNLIFNSGGDGINFYEFQNLQARLSRVNADTLGYFNWTDHLQTYWEGWFTEAHNLSLTSQPLYQTALFTPPGTPTGPLVVSVHNPYLSAADQTTLANALANYAASGYFLGLGAPLDPNWNRDHFYLSRASSDLETGRVGNNDVLARGVLGVKGDFSAFKRDFHWDATMNYGYSRTISLDPAVVFQNEQNAINSVLNSSGQIVCAPGYTNSPFKTESSTCAPLNPFGYGSPSAAARAYVTTIATAEQYNTERDMTANLTGPIVELPAGSWKFAAGVENRREAAVFAPDAFYTTVPSPGDLSSTAIEGAYHTNEMYAETLLPVFEPKLHLPALHRLEFEGAIRRVFNSLAGPSNTWSAGLRWAPTRDVLFRITKTTSIRAPSVSELFLPASRSGEFGDDPCDRTQVGLQPDPALTAKNCAAAGINTATFNSLAVNSTVIGTTSGNTALQSEVAHSYTWGVVLTPRWVPRLSVSLNYLDIDLTGAIEQLNFSELLAACYDSPAYPNVSSCDHFKRNAAGQLVSYNDGYVNAGILHFQGATIEFNYETTLPWNLGAMDWTGNYLDTKTLKTQIGAAPVQNLAGQLGTGPGISTLVPKGRGTLSTTYRKGPFSWYWQGQYSSGMNLSNVAPPNTYNISRVHSWWLFNSSVAYQVTSHIGLRLIVDNVFNKRPPYAATDSVAGNFFAQTSFYFSGIIGRTYMLEAHADLF
jgi:iron complex outermembrane receptor protein